MATIQNTGTPGHECLGPNCREILSGTSIVCRKCVQTAEAWVEADKVIREALRDRRLVGETRL